MKYFSNYKVIILLAIMSFCMFFCGCFSKSGYGSKSASVLRSNYENYKSNESKVIPSLKKDWLAFINNEQKHSGDLSAGFDRYKNKESRVLNNFKKEYNGYINNE